MRTTKSSFVNNRRVVEETLRDMYPKTSCEELAIMLGLSIGMVKRRAYQLGLRKDMSYLSAVNKKNGHKTQYGAL